MFRKKHCKRCNKKISEKYEFCPYCGISFKKHNQEEDWGMLGRNDSINEFERFSKSIFGGISGSMINKMLGGVMNMLEKEMQKEIKKQQPPQRTNFQLFINGKKVNLDHSPNEKIQPVQEIKNLPKKSLSKESLKKMAKLPKQEPKTNIRRFSNRVVYEINMPEVKSLNDISIIQLESSIEVKAVGKNKAYLKLIPISMPISDYKFSKGKLTLELETKD
ncbi:MAG: zinc ribbon domain-containing protein [Nanoarchaeota archaeon]|nr:zinc ribbon domain-containing protein [Nanoarchaeota archaeon]